MHGADQSLSTGDPDNQTPLNPFRFSAKRMDSGTATSPSGTATLDMGARRFGPATGRFQQPDVYYGALSNLGLSTDPLTQNRYSLAGTNPVSFTDDGHMVLPDGSGGSAEAPSVIGAAAAPQPYQEPAAEPEPEPNVLQKAWNNTKDFVGGAKDGAVDAGQGLYQLGYDTFYGASPFADEQTQAETKARAEARGELIKDPGKLIDAVKAPYEQDINSGHDGRAAGRAAFDILTVIGTGGAGTAAKPAPRHGQLTPRRWPAELT
jgi:RHS repeat-associated protein